MTDQQDDGSSPAVDEAGTPRPLRLRERVAEARVRAQWEADAGHVTPTPAPIWPLLRGSPITNLMARQDVLMGRLDDYRVRLTGLDVDRPYLGRLDLDLPEDEATTSEAEDGEDGEGGEGLPSLGGPGTFLGEHLAAIQGLAAVQREQLQEMGRIAADQVEDRRREAAERAEAQRRQRQRDWIVITLALATLLATILGIVLALTV